MSSGRSVAFAGAALLLATGALVTMALTVNEPRPVDVRRVDVSPVAPGVLSASYTTTIEAIRPTTTAVVAIVPPAQRPAPPSTTTTTVPTTTTVEPPPPSSSSVPESTTSSVPPEHENCDPSYVTDGICVPWRFPRGVWRYCDWLHDQGVTRIEVVGWDRHHLDRDRDGIACERAY
jgi:hypothetical protein